MGKRSSLYMIQSLQRSLPGAIRDIGTLAAKGKQEKLDTAKAAAEAEALAALDEKETAQLSSFLEDIKGTNLIPDERIDTLLGESGAKDIAGVTQSMGDFDAGKQSLFSYTDKPKKQPKEEGAEIQLLQSAIAKHPELMKSKTMKAMLPILLKGAEGRDAATSALAKEGRDTENKKAETADERKWKEKQLDKEIAAGKYSKTPPADSVQKLFDNKKDAAGLAAALADKTNTEKMIADRKNLNKDVSIQKLKTIKRAIKIMGEDRGVDYMAAYDKAEDELSKTQSRPDFGSRSGVRKENKKPVKSNTMGW